MDARLVLPHDTDDIAANAQAGVRKPARICAVARLRTQELPGASANQVQAARGATTSTGTAGINTADTTLNYKNLAEDIKEWANLLGLNETPNGLDYFNYSGISYVGGPA